MITGIYTVPTTNQSSNAFKVIDKIIYQLGALNCDECDDAAAVAYCGILSAEHKEKLTTIAKHHDYVLIFVEAEKDTKWIDIETIHVPTDAEIEETFSIKLI